VSRGLFVCATDTGVGKTMLAAALCAALATRGVRVAAFKPVLTGLGEEGNEGAPADDALLASVTGQRREEVAPRRFAPAVSPHLAAQLAGERIDVPALVSGAVARAADVDALIVEGVGGLLVPLAPEWDIRRFALAVGYPLVLAARPGLGTINHTLLSVEVARGCGLDVRAVVLTPWPREPSAIERSNLETISELSGGVAVHTLPVVARLEKAALAAAADGLPCDEWLGERSVPADS